MVLSVKPPNLTVENLALTTFRFSPVDIALPALGVERLALFLAASATRKTKVS